MVTIWSLYENHQANVQDKEFIKTHPWLAIVFRISSAVDLLAILAISSLVAKVSLFLTNDELQELTGYKRGSDQARWLRAQGYYVETNARGVPRITQKQVDEKRQVVALQAAATDKSVGPNVLKFQAKLQNSR